MMTVVEIMLVVAVNLLGWIAYIIEVYAHRRTLRISGEIIDAKSLTIGVQGDIVGVWKTAFENLCRTLGINEPTEQEDADA